MIEAVDLRMTYGKKEILKGISFTVKQGKTVGLLGVNGAGKSTTMNLLTGYLSPTGGSIHICGENISIHPGKAKKQIGYLPEIPPVYPDLRVFDYLRYAAQLKGIKTWRPEVERVMELTDSCEMEREFVRHLSKGYMQRIGFAQALLGDPPVMIFDEPLSGLDPAEAKKLRGLIHSLREEHAIIISSHVLPEIEELCNEILMLKDGALVMDSASVRAKRKTDSDRYQFVIKGDRGRTMHVLQKYQGLQGVRFVAETEPGVFVFQAKARDHRDIRDSVLSYLVDMKCSVYEITRLTNSLEDVFIEAMNKEDE